MRRGWRTLLPIAVLVALVAYLYLQQRVVRTPAASPTASTATAPGQTPGDAADSSRTATLPAFLPSEARDTLALIAQGGPFPHQQDGAVFGNHEHLLPAQPRGYYHEYTVVTPGARNRGARRIVTGGNPPVVWYYSDDHYRSFRAFTVPR